ATRAEIQADQVFPDTVLAELARGRPTSEEALRRVSGVGEFRLQSFGRLFLDAIKAYSQRTGLATDVPPPKTEALPASPKMGWPSAPKFLPFRLFGGGVSFAEFIPQPGMPPPPFPGSLAVFTLAETPASIAAWVPDDVCQRVAAGVEIHGTARLKP